MKNLFDGLNKPQEDAVRHVDGPLLVLAGPGSGKTRVITHRIVWLLEQGVPDWQIVALTFTNKAADQMKSRVAQLAPGSRVWMGTFHRFCSRLLRMHQSMTPYTSNFTIYDTDQSKRLLASLIDKSALPNGVDAEKIGSAISWAKNNLVLPADYAPRRGSLLGQVVVEVYPRYQEALLTANALDFDDLLLQTATLLQENPGLRSDLDNRYRYMLVDEYQDTNMVQYAISRALCHDYPNLCVTGDPDQSIYGWRGANIDNILDFEKDYPNVCTVRLEQNYRSTKSILAVASALIKKNKLRKDKELYTDNATGALPRVLTCFNQHDEAEIIAREIAGLVASGRYKPADIAIFYRTNTLSRNLEHALNRNSVPFQLVRGLEFFSRREIRDIVAYLRLIYNHRDSVAFRRVVNLPARGIGNVTIGKLDNVAAANGCSLFDAARGVQSIDGLSAKTKKSVSEFVAMIERFEKLAAKADLEVLLSLVLRDTKYLESLSVAESEEDDERLTNVQELLSEVREFEAQLDAERLEDEDVSYAPSAPSDSLFDSAPGTGLDRLGRFLERASLVNDVDAWKNGTDRVSLMTLHAAKGLEFPVVYIIAVEDNILPHEKSMANEKQLEEERRLLFVGMTRAKEELTLSRATFREFRGKYEMTIASRFLFDIPSNAVETRDFPEQLSDSGSDGTDELAFLTEHLARTKRKREHRDPFAKVRSGGEIRFDEPETTPEPDAGTKARKGKRHRNAKTEGDELPVYQIDEERGGKETSSKPKSNEREIVPDEEYIRHSAEDIERESETPAKKKAFIRPSAITVGSELDPESRGKTPKLSLVELEARIVPDSLVRHRDYGVGQVRSITGPRGDRIATVEFFSGAGMVDIPLRDPALVPLKLDTM